MSQSGPHGTLLFNYDAAGRRNRFEWSDGFFLNYRHLVTGELSRIAEDPYTGSATIAVFAYDPLGRRSGLARGNGINSSYGYDPVSRLESLAHDFVGSGPDVTFAMTHNPDSQIATRSGAYGAYAWTGHGSGTTGSSADGLNRGKP